MVSEMSNKVFKRNKTILRKIFQKYIPVPTQEQINMFNFDIPKISSGEAEIVYIEDFYGYEVYRIIHFEPYEGEADDC